MLSTIHSTNRYWVSTLLAVGASLLVTAPVVGQSAGSTVGASDAVIHRAGLMVEWSSQAPVGVASELIDWELFVDENSATTTFEVTAGNRREIISQFDRNARGEILGIEGAERPAETRREYLIALHKARGKDDVEVKVQRFQKPTATIYAMSNRGEIAALDADSGKTQWVHSIRQLGLNRLPGIGLGVNKSYVAAVLGSTVYCLEASTGKELWSKPCKYSVGSSPAVTDTRIMVPLTDGRLEVFPIESKGIGSHALMASGEGTAQPLVTATTISWPTGEGQLNVMMRDNAKHAISYRLLSDDAIVASPTFSKGTLFVGSLDGFLYAIDEDRGNTLWEISLGVGIPDSPVPLGDYVFAVSNDYRLYKVDAATGQLAKGWEKPLTGVKKFAGASEQNLYVLDRSGNLLTIDRSSKSVTSRVPVGRADLILNNYQTDRIYLATETGVVQCLREVASRRPFFHGDEPTKDSMASGSNSKSNGQERMDTPTPDDDSNPFGADDGDPFGGDSEDPFGGDDSDPFGGSDPDKDSSDDGGDPFGGDDDSNDAEEDMQEPTEDDEDPFG